MFQTDFSSFFYTIPCLSVVRVVAILFRALIFGVSCEVNRIVIFVYMLVDEILLLKYY